MLFEFASDWFKDLLSVLRDPEQARDIGITWAVSKDVATEQYWQHLHGVPRPAAVKEDGQDRADMDEEKSTLA